LEHNPEFFKKSRINQKDNPKKSGIFSDNQKQNIGKKKKHVKLSGKKSQKWRK
jgi:hypothetical protein